MAIVGSSFVEVHTVAAGFEQELARKVQAATKNVERKTAITPKVDGVKAESESRKLGGVLANLQSRLEGVASKGGPVSRELATIASSAVGAGPALAAAGVGAAALIAVVSSGVAKFQSLAGEIRKFRLISGASAEDSSRFVVALHELGIAPDVVGRAFFRLSGQIDAGTDKLRQHGVAVARDAQGNVDSVATFLNVADAVARATDETEKIGVATDAYGTKLALQLLPALNKGRQGLEDFLRIADSKHLVFNDQDLADAKNFDLSLRALHQSVDALQISLGKGLVPTLTDVALGVGSLVDRANDATQSVGGLGGVIRGVAAVATGGASERLIQLGSSSGDAARAQAALAADVEETAAQMEREGEQAADLRSALLGLIDAQSAARDADQGVEDAKQGLADAQSRLAKLNRDGAVDAGRVRSAQDSLRTSTAGLTRARTDLRKAEEELVKVQQGATANELERADIRLAQSTNSLARAEKTLADMRKHHRRDALGISDAELAVRAARLDQADAQTELTDTQNKGKEGSDEYVAAQERVAQALDSVRSAQTSQASSAASLREAQRGDADFADKVAEAQRGVDRASRSLNSAYEARIKAQLGLDDAHTKEQQALADDVEAIDAVRHALLELQAITGVDLGKLLGLLPAQKPLVGPPNPNAAKYDDRYRRAGGGPTDAGYWYQVNENGQEFFKSNSSGTVVPIGSRQHPGTTSSPTITQHFHGTDPETTAARSGYYVGRAIRTAAR